jgi:hypothetical protein
MDKGFEVLEGMVIIIVAMYAFVIVAPPVILDIIWIKRVKSGKSKIFGPLGIISIIVTFLGLMGLPHLFTMTGEWFGWI